MAETGSSPQRKALIAAVLAACAAVAPLTAQREGYSATPYRDIGGVWTVCNGDTHNVDPSKRYSSTECQVRLQQQLQQHGMEIAGCLPSVLPLKVREAFTDAAYTFGSPTFCRSSMSRLAYRGDLAGACRALDLYVWAAGKDCRVKGSDCRGLVLRRHWERSLCEEGLHAR